MRLGTQLYPFTLHSQRYSFCSSSFILEGKTVGKPGMIILVSSLPHLLFLFLAGGGFASAARAIKGTHTNSHDDHFYMTTFVCLVPGSEGGGGGQ